MGWADQPVRPRMREPLVPAVRVFPGVTRVPGFQGERRGFGPECQKGLSGLLALASPAAVAALGQLHAAGGGQVAEQAGQHQGEGAHEGPAGAAV